jgi:ubiquinone/menaquinone biosynthesis C-methylase UbiE
MHAAFRRARHYADYAFFAVINAGVEMFPALSRAERPMNAINFGGGGDYIAMGDGLVQNIVEHTGLHDGQTVVDIGCGIGRNATALFRRFGDAIDYRGFDIIRHGVTWCRKHFERMSDRYRFERADIYNSAYNPLGRLQASAYIFPYPDEFADVVFATSVFTHMQPDAVDWYITESSRILKPGGLVYFTFFILDAHAETQIKLGKASFSFSHHRGNCSVEDAAEPDGVVAYRLDWVKAALARAGFGEPRLVRASWRDGLGSVSASFQDIMVARKQR